MSRSDRRKADGVTLVPWRQGRALVWDATCVDTLAPSHVLGSSKSAGVAANRAAAFKVSKYSFLRDHFEFLTFAVEKLGPWSSEAKSFTDSIGKLLIDKPGDRRAKAFFIRRISIEIQRGNAASVLGSFCEAGTPADLAEQYIENLFTRRAEEEPSDSVPCSQLHMELPPWFDETKYKLGQKFYWDNLFGCMTSMLTGLLAVLSVPSILAVLVHTKRSSSIYTSYKRYLSTILHTVAWHKHPLRPGSVAWKSLYAVRSRHVRAGASARTAGLTHVSQRDLALTQFGFMGFTVVRADQLGIVAYDADAWEGLVHFWRTIGYMIGLKDEYNLCRATVEETQAVCKVLQQRVFRPCLENAPEPFEHMAYVLLDSMWAVSPSIEVRSMLYFTRYLAEVPGYVYTEQERIDFRSQLNAKLKQLPEANGVQSHQILQAPAVSGLAERVPKIYRPEDYRLLDTVPAYSQLPWYSKHKLHFLIYAHRFFYTTYFGRWFLNINLVISFWLIENFPFLAFPRFGFKKSFVDIFTEGPKDDTVPKRNAECLKEQDETPWYSSFLQFNWMKAD